MYDEERATFLIFFIPHSSFLIPHFFPIPHSSFLIPNFLAGRALAFFSFSQIQRLNSLPILKLPRFCGTFNK